MDEFIGGFWFVTAICVILHLYTRTKVERSTDASFLSFERTYLSVYFLAVAGDWLQGPHVYALYDSYGMTKHQIEILFVAGFGASMLIGTVVGSFADKYGRRANCILYGILYGGACITKHFNNFWILMLGRLLGGTATSILYSAFESWLICEHKDRKFEDGLLSSVFARAAFGNSVVAVASGVLAQFAADAFGYVAPFDVSLVSLIIMCAMLVSTWSENYGDSTVNLYEQFTSAITAIKSDTKVICLGLIQALFEGSMYTFVLEWTPALSYSDPKVHIPHGYIFAGFMVSVMIGSSLFSLIERVSSIESFMRPMLVVAATSLFIPVLIPENHLAVFAAFLCFEVCVGIFWPGMGTMRSRYVPENARATIMNFFRIPLNLIVIFILLQDLPRRTIFSCCTVFLLMAAVAQHWLYRSSAKAAQTADEQHDELPV